jgi:hypothetical protein
MDCSTSSIVSNQIVSSGATKTCKIWSDLMLCYLSTPICESLSNFIYVTPTWLFILPVFDIFNCYFLVYLLNRIKQTH